MRIYFDTEFYEDGETINLMSIGLIREDGAGLYLVNKSCDWNKPYSDDWHLENTIPHLSTVPSDNKDWLRWGYLFKWEIAFEIKRFVGNTSPEFWAYYADYDWVVLCQLFGRMIDLPKGWPMYCRDFKQICDENSYSPSKQTDGEHNAIYDAIWLKREHELFMNGK